MNKRKKYIFGNWKSNKDSVEVREWFKTFTSFYKQAKNLLTPDLEIVIFPSFTYLPLANTLIKEYQVPLKLGSQDISPFGKGAWTGEVAADQLSEWVNYVIIGHSERRNNFHEKDSLLQKKVEEALRGNLIPVYCIQDENTHIPSGVTIVAYEPVWAIGTGKTDSPENAGSVANSVKRNKNIKIVIYGGSVKPDNIDGFLQDKNIDGVLPGGASLDAKVFWELIKHVAGV
ncbi:hypothetical protein A2960_04725 [Candidatus Gottesmanbacteria bacterium RIFCSPLOWO2_01_FULL_39_12b]|uniref:Triosephosphate isomerase n=1 Tax=Candidatus Gottesmanbacteria bacterium RIFCSPLOWO2_01_FULL_39_12b TaxID=1798388 RepID=A0A1F6AP52_9BACT|nr:MAG: hypothetical protein A2960_04725 [Candidatus Gottesmanbacteria bacterium RIFCSPLOWO2_01_FULL_39_12b]